MSMSLTPAQAELLAFIERYLEEHYGVGPSFDEMMAGIGSTSRGGVHRLLRSLEEKGRIRRLPYRARAIEVLDEPLPPQGLAAYPSDELIAELARRSAARREGSKWAA